MTALTLLGHAAVRLDRDGGTLVVDPGVFSDLSTLPSAGAVLISHGHPDHVAAAAVADVDAPVWAPEDVIAQLGQAGVPAERLHAVAPGDSFTAAGFEVSVLGGAHAEIYPGLPGLRNNAYLVDGVILHAGDSFTAAPDPGAVEVLLLPVAAPWLKLAEAIDFARAHAAAAVLPIHDGILSPGGRQLVDNVLTAVLGADRYRRPAEGEAVTC